MNKSDLRQQIRERTLEAGFEVVGFASPKIEIATGQHLMTFLKQGYHGDMGWMAAKSDRRVSPKGIREAPSPWRLYGDRRHRRRTVEVREDSE